MIKLKNNCVHKEKIIRTFHVDESYKDYNRGPCKYLGLFMREMIFQNDNEYIHTTISINPYCLLFGNEYELEELYELPYDTVERLCHEFHLNFENTSKNIIPDTSKHIIYDTPEEQLINILKGYEINPTTIYNDGRLKIPKHINEKIDEIHGPATVYYDDDAGDVFIHFNIDKINNAPNVNNRKLKEEYQK